MIDKGKFSHTGFVGWGQNKAKSCMEHSTPTHATEVEIFIMGKLGRIGFYTGLGGLACQTEYKNSSDYSTLDSLGHPH